MAALLLRIAQIRTATGVAARMEPGIPNRDLAASLDGLELAKQSKRFARRSLQHDPVRIQPHRDIAVLFGGIVDAAGVAITPVGQNVLTVDHRKLAQRLPGPIAFHGTEFEVVAPQRWPAQAIMNPPLGAGRTGLFNKRPIHQTQAVLRADSGSYPALFKQGPTQLIEPFPALA